MTIVALCLIGGAAATVAFVPQVHDAIFGKEAPAKVASKPAPSSTTSAPASNAVKTVTIDDVKRRLPDLDARGDMGIYRMSIEAGSFVVNMIMDPKNEVARVEFDGGAIQTGDERHVLYKDGKTQIFRDYSPEDEEGIGRVTSVEQKGRTFTGLIISVTEKGTSEANFTLVVDAQGRFSSLSIGTDISFDATFSYDVTAMPAWPSNAERGPIDLEITEDVEPADGMLWTVGVLASEAARASELEFRWLDSSGKVVAKTGFEADFVQGDYRFEWKDENSNALVDLGDKLVFTFPETASRVRVYDEWAAKYTDGYKRLEVPGFEAFGLLAAVALVLFMVRRRSRVSQSS